MCRQKTASRLVEHNTYFISISHAINNNKSHTTCNKTRFHAPKSSHPSEKLKETTTKNHNPHHPHIQSGIISKHHCRRYRAASSLQLCAVELSKPRTD